MKEAQTTRPARSPRRWPARLRQRLARELRRWAGRLDAAAPALTSAHPFDALRAAGAIDPSVQYAGSSCGLMPGAQVEIGPESMFLGRLVFHRPGRFRMGARSYVGPGTEIHVTQRVTLGDDVMIAWNCTLLDTDNHALDPALRSRDVLIAGRYRGCTLADKDWSTVRCAPIEIADAAWLGIHSIVLPGVRIGRGAVIGAGSVVTRAIPDDVVAAGNPARVIRTLRPAATCPSPDARQRPEPARVESV